ncbi:tRNA (adenine(22)-N(1))-methyltransferase [Gehongia tenuis]|uniref:SAM-dependent methyltransferase n=1 Tax=Gehongia tenuis TaxID=2763655 RepID=A0A926D405_9FIRM|nr:class I SAM-dependent methyltransferase [Gehongia tenuis]MBC8530923.1 SAM-dependent methyltransferase [Gehongia tenuis]
MRLSKRLEAILNKVPMDSRMADIGTDHGRLMLAALVTGRCRKVYGVDISEPSLNKARALFSGRELNAEFLLGSGVDPLALHSVDAAVLAGMGSQTIRSILASNRQDIPCWILQPMSQAPLLREFLVKQGFRIDSEDLVWENRRFYSIIQCSWGEDRERSWAEYQLGWKLIETRHPLLPELVAWREKYLRRAAGEVLRSDPGDGEGRAAELMARIKQLKEAVPT